MLILRDNIVLFGLTIQSANKGCEALAHSFLNLLNEYYKNNSLQGNISLVMELSAEDQLRFENKFWNNLNVSILINKRKSFSARRKIFHAIKDSNLVIDFTDGDSFSDIYGFKRFFDRSFDKLIVIGLNKKLLLGPQTYGPYKNKFCENIARYIFKHSIIYSRDETSALLVEKLTNERPKVVTDIAMMLPIDKDVIKVDKSYTNIGINVSSLLYNGGYTCNNQFNLKLDYKEYIDRLIHYLKNNNYSIYLIPHVISEKEDFNNVENDLKVCESISNKFGIKFDKDFYQYADPMQLKGVISQMDCFIGARMHSTIASYSSGVPTIPFAYSKKFKGLFGALDYCYTVDGRDLNTEEALKLTIKYINSLDEVKKDLIKSRKIAFEKCAMFKQEVFREVLKWTN